MLLKGEVRRQEMRTGQVKFGKKSYMSSQVMIVVEIEGYNSLMTGTG